MSWVLNAWGAYLVERPGRGASKSAINGGAAGKVAQFASASELGGRVRVGAKPGGAKRSAATPGSGRSVAEGRAHRVPSERTKPVLEGGANGVAINA